MLMNLPLLIKVTDVKRSSSQIVGLVYYNCNSYYEGVKRGAAAAPPAGARHRELICMHSGIVKRNRFHGRRVLQILSQALPAQTVCCAYDLDWSSRRRNKPHGQAVPGSESGAAAVRGVKFRSLVRGVLLA